MERVWPSRVMCACVTATDTSERPTISQPKDPSIALSALKRSQSVHPYSNPKQPRQRDQKIPHTANKRKTALRHPTRDRKWFASGTIVEKHRGSLTQERPLSLESLPSGYNKGGRTLLYSRSQHLTILSKPQENMYGWRGLTANPVTCSICPVSVSLSCPEARSQILMVRSALPVQNHSFPGSTATERT